MLNKRLLIAALAATVAGTVTLSPLASASDPLLGALIGGGIGAAIGHGVNGRAGAWVGGTLGAVTGASIAANSGGYYDGGYNGNAYGGVVYDSGYGYNGGGYYGTWDGYAAPVAYYAPVPVYRATTVVYRPGPVYVPARLQRYPYHDGRNGWNTGGHRWGGRYSDGGAHGYDGNRYDR